MQHFIFSFWIIIASLPLIVFLCKALSFRKNFIKQTLITTFINQPFFSTPVINALTDYIFKQSSSLRKQLIQDILQKNTPSLLSRIPDNDIKSLLKLLFQSPKKFPATQSPLLTISIAQHFVNLRLYDKAGQYLKNLNDQISSPSLAALKLLLDAHLLFIEGDLLNSSAWCFQAASIFKKHRFYYEEAQCYLLLYKIYQAGNFCDHAEIMLRQSLKLFNALKCQRYSSLCLCHLGALFADRKCFDDALSYFNQAQSHADSLSDKQPFYFALCHAAMLDIVLNNPYAAINKLNSINLKNCEIELIELFNRVNDQSQHSLNKIAQ